MSPSIAAEGAQPVATITPSVLNVQQGQRAEFRCTVTGNPTPAIEWIGMTSFVVFGAGLVYLVIVIQAERSVSVFLLYYFWRISVTAGAKKNLPAALSDGVQLCDCYRRSREQNESQSCDTRWHTELHSSGPS